MGSAPPPQLRQQLEAAAAQGNNGFNRTRALQSVPGPMSFAGAPGGQMRGPTTQLAASGTNGFTYAPNRFSGQPTGMTGPPPQMAPPQMAPPQQMTNPPNPAMAQQQAQIAALRNPRPALNVRR